MSLPSSPPKYKIIVDENIRREVAEHLIAIGCDVKIPPKGLKNGQVFKLAIAEGRIFLTHDKDFLDPFLHPASLTNGIVVIRIHPPTVPVICASLDRLLKELSPENLDKRLVLLRNNGYKLT
ncbi:MAG: DUF5615 family PIN-like protein [Candidatus Omnitrophica bacterium]|nr:DUF5615 family PIN-like protein [Candidatus Omnitrophota bacterium]